MKPTINNIERNLKTNIDELREKISSITQTQNKLSSTFRPTQILKDDSEIYDNDKTFGNSNKSKLENIQTIAEKLHEKLTEKVFKLSNSRKEN